jgi:hypothetical protein
MEGAISIKQVLFAEGYQILTRWTGAVCLEIPAFSRFSRVFSPFLPEKKNALTASPDTLRMKFRSFHAPAECGRQDEDDMKKLSSPAAELGRGQVTRRATLPFLQPSYVSAARFGRNWPVRESSLTGKLRCAMFNRAEQNHPALQEGAGWQSKGFCLSDHKPDVRSRLNDQILNRGGSLFAFSPISLGPLPFLAPDL